ncbi:hypothetical protein Dxin01_02119 [Deinococcus xinjiangensis]|uniref:Uncharacterized protein n=1 Tax=Deinococcus xinjiangensis TaxID=457454 RepID=A0ABP9VCU9_9DEIO
MTISAADVIEAEEPRFTRQIEIRLARPTPHIRYEKGKVVKEPVADMERVIEKIRPELTVALQSLYGGETEVRITLAQAADIRVQGQFKDKAGVIRAVVEDLLSNVFDHLELGED